MSEAPRTRGAKTKDILVQSVLTTLREQGITGTSARSVAATAGVNQALIFYHFGDMETLLAEACRRSTEERVQRYHDRFAAVGSMRQLLDLGRQIHTTERAEGNVSVLAQLLAAAQNDAALAEVTADALNLWVAEIETVLTRLFRTSPLAEVIDAPGLSRAVSAAFVGLELYEGVDPQGAAGALDALDQLGRLLTLVEDLGPLTRRTVRARVRKAASSATP